MVCHQYKCIFVHIPKTAGQSIERVFLKQLGLTWRTRTPLLMFENNIEEIGPPRLAHLAAQEYVKYQYLSKELFNSYFKFSIVRNPWDRALSFYYYLGFDSKTDFNSFLTDELKYLRQTNNWFVKPQVEFLLKGESLLVDYVAKFENLQHHFNYISKKIGLKICKLQHTNKSNRKDDEHYSKYYDNKSKDIIYKLYKEDVKKFSYEF